MDGYLCYLCFVLAIGMIYFDRQARKIIKLLEERKP